MKKSVLLLILTAMAITASACNGSDVTGTMTMNSSAKQEAKSTEASIAGNENLSKYHNYLFCRYRTGQYGE